MADPETINISGIVVHTRPEFLPSVRSALETLPGVEVHAATDAGRVVVTVEAENGADMADAFVRIQNLEHVINASLVYQHSESTDASEAEINS